MMATLKFTDSDIYNMPWDDVQREYNVRENNNIYNFTLNDRSFVVNANGLPEENVTKEIREMVVKEAIFRQLEGST